MFPFERNGVRPLKEGSYESWHQVIPVPPTPAVNPDDRYNWGEFDALFEEQTRVVTFDPQINVPQADASPSKRKSRVLGPTKLRRVRRHLQSAPGKESSTGGRSLRIRKRGTPIFGLLQKIKKKLKKRNQKLRRKMQSRLAVVPVTCIHKINE